MKRRLLTCMLAFVLTATVCCADDIDDLIETLKPSPLSYDAWAESLLEAASALQRKPTAQARVYAKAYEFGLRKPDGYPAAIRAARAAVELEGEDRAAWQQKLLDTLKRAWTAAPREKKVEAGNAYVGEMIAVADDLAAEGRLAEAVKLYTDASYRAKSYAPTRREEVVAKLKAARQRQQLVRTLAGLKRVLAAHPDNATVRERLARLYLAEFDDPAEAAGLVTEDLPEAIRKYVPKAAKGAEGAPKASCVELGDWYGSLAARATSGGKANVLARAMAYYQRFLQLESDPVKTATVQAKLDRTAKALGQLGPRIPTGGRLRKTLVLDLGKGVKMKLVLIPAGSFVMGLPSSCGWAKREEMPSRKVTITKPFYLGVTEVTQAQWVAVMDTAPWRGRPDTKEGADRPAVNLNWAEAVSFCDSVADRTGHPARLPTEAEWEYACRAGTTTKHYFDNSDPDRFLWHSGNTDGVPQPVGLKKPNRWGLYDMHGNAHEWCRDWYAEDYYSAQGNTVDPQGPKAGQQRVTRSGCVKDVAHACRSTRRFWSVPEGRWPARGLRVAITATAGARSPSAAGASRPTGKELILSLAADVDLKLLRIPAGNFVMGSPSSEASRQSHEGPQHKVTISRAFYMGRTEVTVGQFGAFVDAAKYKTDAEKAGQTVRSFISGKGWAARKLSWRDPGFKQSPEHPVLCVSWNDAVAFCRWAGKKTGHSVRLPTEAQWEYACRAGTTGAYGFGDDADDLHEHAWFHRNSGGGSKPVGKKKPNPWGLHDMHGNAEEWCLDWYASDYYSRSPRTDPAGPDSGRRRVKRDNDGWIGNPKIQRCASRRASPCNWQDNVLGFRVVVIPQR